MESSPCTVQERVSCSQSVFQSQGEELERGLLQEAKTQDISVPMGYPLSFRTYLCILTKVILHPNAYISVCLTCRRVLAASCLEPSSVFFISVSAFLFAPVPKLEKLELSCDLYVSPLALTSLLLFYFYLLFPLSDWVWPHQLSCELSFPLISMLLICPLPTIATWPLKLSS